MVNPAKYLVQAVLAGVNVIGRAFIQSYQRVAQGPKQAAAKAAGGEATTEASAFSKRRMRLDEAKKILNIEGVEEKNVTPKEFGDLLNSRYEQLYSANSVEKSGSFYLQSKIFRAKEVIDDDFERRYGFKPFKIKVDAAAAPGAGPAADAKAGPSATTPPPS